MASTPDPIAVIGIGCRFPGGVGSPEELWELVSEGRTGLSVVPAERWNADSFYHPDPEARESLNTKKGYFLKQDVSEFDARFFGFSAAEAEQTDPQQRIVLETTYEALENAGIPLDDLKGSNTSVFVSVFARDYDRMTWKDIPQIQKHAITGNGEAILAARISYVFDLRGGAMTIDTGCSGSMVAIHQACLSLRSGESRVAIAAGTELLLHPDQFVPWSFNGMANPEGQCFAFDDRGAGYGRGEGVGTVVLKRLSHAIQDGDPIHAVILNSGINQDGKTAGILLPNGASQYALVKQVYESAGLDPSQTLYVEAHGTGTQAGDNAEIESISRAIVGTKRDRELYVGSVKANIGHLEASSGIAGFVKAVMVLKHKQVPPQPNFVTEKPGLNLKERGIKIPTQLEPLVPDNYAGPHRVSVSSYGYGGTNAHVVLEAPETAIAGNVRGVNGHHEPNEVSNAIANGNKLPKIVAHHTNGITEHLDGATEPNGLNGARNGHPEPNRYTSIASEVSPKSTPQLLFPLSAHSEATLTSLPYAISRWISTQDHLSSAHLKDLSYTLSCRRSTFRWRGIIAASSWDELKAAVTSSYPFPTKTRSTAHTNISFIFTGQGAQWFAMGRELLTTSRSSIFLSSLQKSNSMLSTLGCPWDLLSELTEPKTPDESRISQAEFAQPLTTAIQIALVDLLSSLGITASRVVGHSSGEIAAAYASHNISHQSAMRVAYFRGKFSGLAKDPQYNSAPGAMLAVAAGEATVNSLCKIVTSSGKNGRLGVACINSPESVTVSGDATAVRELERMMDLESGVPTRRLIVDTAYHSHHMESVKHAYLDAIGELEEGGEVETEKQRSQDEVTFFSAVTGKVKTDGDFGAAYWTENLVSQVRFSDALQALAFDIVVPSAGANLRDSSNVFIEIGPHSALQGPVRQTLAQVQSLKYTYLPSLVRKKDAARSVVSTVGRLFELGFNGIDFNAVLNMQLEEDHHETRRVISDLPPYPWDHSKKHWRESRLSRDHRLRQFPYHDLLGLLDVMSPVHEPRWRYHISVDSFPWLGHHVVERQVIWPGTGFMCMAIEAAKQLSQLRNPGSAVCRLALKDFEIKKAVIVPSEQFDGHGGDVEVQLVISANTSSDGSPWESVRILSILPDSSWTQNFSGQIRVDLAISANNSVDWAGGDEDQAELALALEHMERIQSLANSLVDPETLYSTMRAAGNDFGPSFTTLSEIRLGKRVGFARMTVPDFGLYMPKAFYQPHTIHPAVLDVPNHVMGLLFYEECVKAAVMPTTTAEFKISTTVDVQPGDELVIACEITPEGKKAALGNTWLFKRDPTAHTLQLFCSTRSIKLVAVGEGFDHSGDALEAASQQAFHRKKTYDILWSDHISFLSEPTYHDLVTSSFTNPPDRLPIAEQLWLNDQAAAIYLERALDPALGTLTVPPSAPAHLSIFHTWITSFLNSSLHHDLLPSSLSPEGKDALLHKSVTSGIEGQMLAVLGSPPQTLRSILMGETHPLNLMLQDDLLNKFYMDGPLEASNVQTAEFVRLLAQNNPHMRVLEIGAGTGGTTASLLSAALSKDNGEVLLDKYCYTDISAGFFTHAEEKFAKWSQYLEFKVLDISRDPNSQVGWEGVNAGGKDVGEGQFDLIVASNVIHATPVIAETLANVRKLLRPGGRFVLVEVTRPTVAEGMIFGTLSGWWESQDGRKETGSPCLSRDGWNAALQQAGFNGIEFASYDHDGPLPRTSVIVSKAVINNVNGHHITGPEICIINPPASTTVSTAIADQLSNILTSRASAHCSVADWDSLDTTKTSDMIYVVLDNLDNSVLLHPTPAIFEKIKSLLTTCTRLNWVSFHQSTGKSDIAALKGLATGAARTLRRENEGMQFITLDIHDAIVSPDPVADIANAITNITISTLHPPTQADYIPDTEFSLRHSFNRIMVPRLFTDADFNRWADRLNDDGRTEPTPFTGSDMFPLKLEVKIPGLLSSICFAHDPLPAQPLLPDEIQLESKAFGVNFRDVFKALGQMPPSTPFAGEVAGVVTAVGSGDFVQEHYKVGDRVIGLLGEAYSSHSRMKGVHCAKLPGSVGFVEGASIYTVYLTCWYGLVEIARLERGQSVLIHSASGGVGQAAIQIAHLLGAQVYATVGSKEKADFVRDEYGIPDERIFSSRANPSGMKRKVMQLTRGKGVNVVINSLAGEILAESWDCLAPLGVHIELSKTDIYKKSSLSMAPFDRNLTFAAIDLTVLLANIPEKLFVMLGRILDLFDRGILAPVRPLNVLGIDEIEAAFRLIAERKHMGKVILEARQGAMVNALLRPPPPLKLAKEGTYLVAGGLGDLGRRISRLLAGFGAGHIVALSRRPLDESALVDFRKQVEDLGATLHVMNVDITDRQCVEEMKRALDSKSLPPVKGIVHGAMVLKDRPFASMELDDWQQSLGPKVTGTINLDQVFWTPHLDFFITLASISGIAGRLAQSNYAAGNCFQDAYTHERKGKTQTRYWTINVGAVAGSNSITSMQANTAQRLLLESASMSFTELFQALQYVMDPATATSGTAQSAMGFDRNSLLSQDHIAAASPFFSMLPYTDPSAIDSKQTGNSVRDLGAALRSAPSVDDAADVIAKAIGDKLVGFINRDIEDIGFDQPLSGFGIDSLISIELKNWIMRTFSVTLQASELNGPASIIDLSKTLAERSTIVSSEIKRTKKVVPADQEIDGIDTNGKVEPATEEPSSRQPPGVNQQHPRQLPAHGFECCRQFEELPRQPIPDFDQTMKDHLNNVMHFAADEEELETFQQAIAALTAPGSTGREIYERLVKEAANPSIENWSSEYLLKAIHLSWRQGLAYSSFMLLQHEGKTRQSQAERAAIIATVAQDYKEALQKGEIQGGWMFEAPQCNHLQGWMFNSVREPALGCDISRQYESDDLAVFKSGRLFRVPLKNSDGTRCSLAEIRDCIGDILLQVSQDTPDNVSWAGILTADNRDSWARNRESLLEFDTRNAEYLRAVEAATLVINLDDGKPENITDQISQVMLNGGMNRWFDKPVQFVVAANGRSSVILEHSRVDGVTALGLLYQLRDAIDNYQPSPSSARTSGTTNGHHPHTPTFQELSFIPTRDISSHITDLAQSYSQMQTQREFITPKTTHLSKNLLVSHNMPIKGIVEATIQLASRLYHHGHSADPSLLPIESWEGVALAHYHKGRHDMVQQNSPAVTAFITAVTATVPSLTRSQKRALMLQAAGDMTASVKRGMAGQGYFRLLNVVKELWPAGAERPAYFEHPIVRRIMSYTLVVTMLDPVAPAAAAMPANPQSLRIRYAVGDDDITFGIVGPTAKVREWEGCLDEAARVVRGLVLGEE